MIHVKLRCFPSPSKEFKIPVGTTLQAFLSEAEQTQIENASVLVNDKPGILSCPLKDGDSIVIFRLVVGELIVKHGGVWQVHKTDLDPWPSNCHAHNRDVPYEVLDVYTGTIYSKVTRKKLRKLKRKDLIAIQDDLIENGLFAIE